MRVRTFTKSEDDGGCNHCLGSRYIGGYIGRIIVQCAIVCARVISPAIIFSKVAGVQASYRRLRTELTESTATLPVLVETMSPNPLILDTQQGYDLWSELYDTDGNPLILLEEPQVDQLLGPAAGLHVLDVGCGTGRHTIRLAQAGAKVTGIDFSEGMLSKARQKPGADKATFLVHDLRQPLPFPPANFDRVICCLVLDHVADVNAFSPSSPAFADPRDSSSSPSCIPR